MTDDGNRKSVSRQLPPAAKLFCYLVDVVGPTLERIAHLAFISRAVIDASDACLMARDMVQRDFHDMGQHTKLSHLRCSSPPQIM
jgi:hypothetical protein